MDWWRCTRNGCFRDVMRISNRDRGRRGVRSGWTERGFAGRTSRRSVPGLYDKTRPTSRIVRRGAMEQGSCRPETTGGYRKSGPSPAVTRTVGSLPPCRDRTARTSNTGDRATGGGARSGARTVRRHLLTKRRRGRSKWTVRAVMRPAPRWMSAPTTIAAILSGQPTDH